MIPTIRPISELKNTTSISNLCHKIDEPVFITKNGYSDLVIMSIGTYERKMALHAADDFDAPLEGFEIAAEPLPRIGFLEGQISVPDDFDRMGEEAISEMFEGSCEDAGDSA